MKYQNIMVIKLTHIKDLFFLYECKVQYFRNHRAKFCLTIHLLCVSERIRATKKYEGGFILCNRLQLSCKLKLSIYAFTVKFLETVI